MITFGIKIATYKRKKDKTRELFPRTVESVLKQTYSHWKVYLVGDKYEPAEEFRDLASLFPSERIVFLNNDVALERDRYTGHKLWMCGGINSINKIMDVMTEQGVEVIATLDDDDVWHDNHLETLDDAYTTFPEADFVFTKGRHVQMGDLPAEEVGFFYNNRPPLEHATIHSTTSWRLQKIPLRYVNTVDTDNPLPGDADLWIRMRAYMAVHKMKYLYVPKLTVWHDEHNPIHEGWSEFLA